MPVEASKKRPLEVQSQGRNPPTGIPAGKDPFEVVHLDGTTLVAFSRACCEGAGLFCLSLELTLSVERLDRVTVTAECLKVAQFL